MLALEWKERAFIEKVNSRCFCWFPAAIFVYQNCTQIWRLHIQSSTMVREMFRQITQKLWATWTWGLDKLFTYQSFVTFHFAASSTGRFPIYLVPCLLRDRENDLYRIAKKCHDFHRCCRWLHHYYSRGCHVRLYLMKLDSTSVISSCFLKEKGLYLRLWFQLN